MKIFLHLVRGSKVTYSSIQGLALTTEVSYVIWDQEGFGFEPVAWLLCGEFCARVSLLALPLTVQINVWLFNNLNLCWLSWVGSSYGSSWTLLFNQTTVLVTVYMHRSGITLSIAVCSMPSDKRNKNMLRRAVLFANLAVLIYFIYTFFLQIDEKR